MKQDIYDVVIVGGGIVGQLTALSLKNAGCRALILEKTASRNRDSGSHGLTRSIRRDYLDPLYIQLAAKAQEEWWSLEDEAGQSFYDACGLINLAPDPVFQAVSSPSYAQKAYEALRQQRMETVWIDKSTMPFPFCAPGASMDPTGGLIRLNPVFEFLERQKLAIQTNVTIASLDIMETECRISTSCGDYRAGRVIIAAGMGTKALAGLIRGQPFFLPLEASRPKTVRYYYPPESDIRNYSTAAMPVFACLDLGVYGHPVVEGVTPGIKIGFYAPPFEKIPEKFSGIPEFVERMMPALSGFASSDVIDTDTGFYDMTPDGDFIVGPLPECERVLVAAGWNGTGFKFAPLMARYLSQYALEGRLSSALDRFDPGRFKAFQEEARAV